MTYGSLYGTNHVVSNPNTIEAEMSENTGKGTCQSELSLVHRITGIVPVYRNAVGQDQGLASYLSLAESLPAGFDSKDEGWEGKTLSGKASAQSDR